MICRSISALSLAYCVMHSTPSHPHSGLATGHVGILTQHGQAKDRPSTNYLRRVDRQVWTWKLAYKIACCDPEPHGVRERCVCYVGTQLRRFPCALLPSTVVSGLEKLTAKARSNGRRLYVRLPVPSGLQRTLLDLCLALPHLRTPNIDHPLCQNAYRQVLARLRQGSRS
jgi:hypothetical protein